MPLTNKIESMKKKMIISFIVVATVMSFIGSSYSNNNTNDLLLDNHYCPVKILDLEINRVDNHPLGR